MIRTRSVLQMIPVHFVYIFVFILFFNSCISINKEEALSYTTYTSLHSGFSMKYPKNFIIFETDELIKISNNTVDIIRPDGERLKEKGSFLVELSVVEEDIFSEFYSILHNIPYQKGAQNNAPPIFISDMQALKESNLDASKKSVPESTPKATIETLFQESFFIDIPEQNTLSYALFNDGFVIGTLEPNEEGLITVFLVKKFINEYTYFVVENITFNETLQQDNDLSSFLFIANSIELEYNK